MQSIPRVMRRGLFLFLRGTHKGVSALAILALLLQPIGTPGFFGVFSFYSGAAIAEDTAPAAEEEASSAESEETAADEETADEETEAAEAEAEPSGSEPVPEAPTEAAPATESAPETASLEVTGDEEGRIDDGAAATEAEPASVEAPTTACRAEGAEKEVSRLGDWEISESGKVAQTREKVKLGVQYAFPGNDDVAVTFTCLPTDESKLDTLRIEEIDADRIDLPEGVVSVSPYAYDITTGMDNGDFAYDISLPKEQGIDDARVAYIEKSVSEATSQELAKGDLKEVDEADVSDRGDAIDAEGLDHFTIFMVVANQTIVHSGVTNPDNGWVSDNLYAVFDADGESVEYGLPDIAIPGEAIINGIEVLVEGKNDNSRDWNVSLWNVSNNNPDAYTTSKFADITTTEATLTLGTPTDLWGETWTAADFADATFKVRVQADNDTGTASLDRVEVKVHYTVGTQDLVVTKTNNTAGAALLGTPFIWTLTVTNAGTGNATFNNQDILLDNLPSTGATYALGTVTTAGGVTGTVDCNVSSNTLDCDDNSGGASVVMPGGSSITVPVTVTPTAVGSLVNPRAAGVCKADPNNAVAESDGNNNSCANTVLVTSPYDLSVTKTNNVGGATVVNSPFVWTLTVANTGTRSLSFTNGQDMLEDDLPDANATFGDTSDLAVVTAGGLTGTVDCDITNDETLDCDASGTVTLPVGASFSVDVSVTPTAAATYANPRSGQGNICRADPDTLVSESNEQNNDCSDSVTVTQYQVTENPSLSQACGLDIALVIDNSGSISESELNHMKGAMTGFTSALNGTPTEYSVTKFADVGSAIQAFTGNIANVNAALNGIPVDEGATNWQDGLAKTQTTLPNRANPNLVIFASDGNPNRTGNPQSTVPEAQAVSDAVTVANAIKASGTRVIALGIGDNLDVDNLKAISGPTVGTNLGADVITADFSTLASTLATFASETCGRTVTVTKKIDADGNLQTVGDQTVAQGWTFDIGGQTGQVTDANGQTPAVTLASGAGYSVTETQQAGNSLLSAACVGAADNGSEDLANNRVTGLQVANGNVVTCTFINTPLKGSITIVKDAVPDHEQDFAFTATGTGLSDFSLDDDGNSGNELSHTKTFSGLAAGSYAVAETAVAGWELTDVTCSDQSPASAISLQPGENVTCTFTNTLKAPVTIVATKIVCTEEADLPNWGSGGPDITPSTAADWVASHESCSLAPDWRFQWSYDGTPHQGDNVADGGAGWTTSEPTDANGQTILEVPNPDASPRIWLREVYQDDYIPFTYNLAGGNTDPVSAELYCHDDVLNFDNWDWVGNPENGGTYHCVAWNAPKTGAITVTKYQDCDGNGEQDLIFKDEIAQEGEEEPNVCQENGLEGWTVYLDLNHNGQLDAGEPSGVTGPDGTYEFTDVLPGNYVVEEVPQEGWEQTENSCGPAEFEFPTDNLIALDRVITVGGVTVEPGSQNACVLGNTANGKLTIDKTNDSVAEEQAGDTVAYTLTVQALENAVQGVTVTDLPPEGFEYVPGSAQGSSDNPGHIGSIDLSHEYASPGVWSLGDMEAGETVTLSYSATISGGVDPGTYTDLAYARGNAGSNPVIASDVNDPASSFVGTAVAVGSPASNPAVHIDTDHETETDTDHETEYVLGASTLPGTGANGKFLAFAVLFLLAGIGLLLWERRTAKLTVLTLMLCGSLYGAQASAASLAVDIETPDAVVTGPDFKIGFVALDIQNRPVQVECSVLPANAVFQTTNLIPGGSSGDCQVDGSVMPADGDYQFFVKATAGGDEAVSSTVNVKLQSGTPGTPHNYDRDQSTCDDRLSFTTANDGGQTVKVEAYRSTEKDFIAVNPVATLDIGSNQNGLIIVTPPDCQEDYWYAIRAVAANGNASGFVGDEDVDVDYETDTETETVVLPNSQSGGAGTGGGVGGDQGEGAGDGTVGISGATSATDGTAAGEGEVLGEMSSEEEAAGALEAGSDWTKKHPWLTAGGLIALILLAAYVYRRKYLVTP